MDLDPLFPGAPFPTTHVPHQAPSTYLVRGADPDRVQQRSLHMLVVWAQRDIPQH